MDMTPFYNIFHRNVNEEHAANLAGKGWNDKIIFVLAGASASGVMFWFCVLLSAIPFGMPKWMAVILFISNTLQLCYLPVIQITQKNNGEHSELRAAADHLKLLALSENQNEIKTALTSINDKLTVLNDDLILFNDRQKK